MAVVATHPFSDPPSTIKNNRKKPDEQIVSFTDGDGPAISDNSVSPHPTMLFANIYLAHDWARLVV